MPFLFLFIIEILYIEKYREKWYYTSAIARSLIFTKNTRRVRTTFKAISKRWTLWLLSL